jgi:ATP adenylyltransferase
LAADRLWAPWRLPYITREKAAREKAAREKAAREKAAREKAAREKAGGEKTDECIFCTKPALDDESALIVRRGDRCFVMLNAFPYTSGHVMVAPYEHTADLASLDEATGLELITLTQESIRAIGVAYSPDGFNVGANLGTVAGAGIADHLHFHVVPRWEGDTNFMSVIGDVRVLPESLEDTQHRLQEAFAAL